MFKTFVFAMLTVVALVSCSASQSRPFPAGSVLAILPRAMLMPKKNDVSYIYMTLKNLNSNNITLVGVKSNATGTIVLRKSGQATKNAAQSELTIPAGGTVVLNPRGYFIMLDSADANLVVGQSIDVTLEFDNGNHLLVRTVIHASRAGGFRL